jgi:hypothetical protein
VRRRSRHCDDRDRREHRHRTDRVDDRSGDDRLVFDAARGVFRPRKR